MKLGLRQYMLSLTIYVSIRKLTATFQVLRQNAAHLTYRCAASLRFALSMQAGQRLGLVFFCDLTLKARRSDVSFQWQV